MTHASYLFTRNNRYYYVRRIPKELKHFDIRKFVRVALKTDSRSIALTKAKAINAQTENYWVKLVEAGQKHTDIAFLEAVAFSKQLGFTYLPHHTLVQERPYPELSSRLVAIEKSGYNEKHVEALWGGVEQPQIRLSSCMDIFFDITKDRIIGKDANQIRKWRNPKSRVLRDFIAVVNDKYFHEITRDDTFKYRDWWISRINEFSYVPESANKDFTHIKDIITTVATHHKIKIDKDDLFGKIFLAEDNEQKRLPFETDYIVNVLLTDDTYSDLTEDEKYILMAMADTGARDGEIVKFGESKGTTQLQKSSIPEHLQEIHQNIIDLRHGRYAHHGDHETIETRSEIKFNGSSFIVTPSMQFIFCLGAPKEWAPLFQWLDEHMHEMLHKKLDFLTKQTGIKWEIPNGPAPEWIPD